MSTPAISLLAFACVFGGALLGTLLRTALPEHHMSSESKDVVRLGTGLIATISALVLGLLIATAQTSYVTLRNDFMQMSTNIVLLDRTLAHYGPETTEVRGDLRRAVVDMLDYIGLHLPLPVAAPPARADLLFDKLQTLRPQSDIQRSLQAQALSLILSLGQTRQLMFEEAGRSIPMPFLAVLVFWLTIIFVSFGLYAPPNATVITVLFLCSVSTAGAIFLILDMDQAFTGWIQIPTTPLRNALAQLGQHIP